MKNMLKLGLILVLYATAACVGLAFVYTGTSEVIAQRQKADLEAALSDLFPGADSFEDATGSLPSADPAVSFKNEYVAKTAGAVSGVAVRASAASYGGALTVLVGIGADGKISGVKVLENKDTPGLGANASNPAYFVDRTAKTTFVGQFAGKDAGSPFEVKADVQAITASTITSKAVASAVRAAARSAGAWLSSQGANK